MPPKTIQGQESKESCNDSDDTNGSYTNHMISIKYVDDNEHDPFYKP